MHGYGEDLAAIHAAGFTALASAAARDVGAGSFRCAQETHRLRLHRPGDVLKAPRVAGFSTRTLSGGSAGEPMPRGLVVYLAHKR